MKLPLIATAIGVLVSASLSSHHQQIDAAAPPQAITPLIKGNYLVAAPGRVEPATGIIRIGASVTAVLKEVTVKAGDHVTKNEVVARLQSDELSAAVAKAQADLLLAKARLERVVNGALPAQRAEALAGVSEAEADEKRAASELTRQQNLAGMKIVSKAALEQAERAFAVAHEQHEAAVDRYTVVNEPTRQEDVAIAQAQVAAAQAALEAAQAALNNTVIRSPIDGVVLHTYLHPGDLLSVFYDQPIMTIGDVSKLYVRAEVDEADIAQLKPDLPAYVTADAYGNKHFTGRVERVSDELGQKTVFSDDPKQRTDTKVLDVLIALDEPNPLRPGLQVNAFIMQQGPAVTAQAAE